MGLDSRRVIVEAMRAAMLREGERLAYMAHAETGLGRAEDKVQKNLMVTTKTPGPEDLEPQAVTGDGGMMVTEYAPVRRHRLDHPDDQSDLDDHQQQHRDDRRRQRGHVQRAPRRQAGLGREHPAPQPGDRRRRRAARPDHRGAQPDARVGAGS